MKRNYKNFPQATSIIDRVPSNRNIDKISNTKKINIVSKPIFITRNISSTSHFQWKEVLELNHNYFARSIVNYRIRRPMIYEASLWIQYPDYFRNNNERSHEAKYFLSSIRSLFFLNYYSLTKIHGTCLYNQYNQYRSIYQHSHTGYSSSFTDKLSFHSSYRNWRYQHWVCIKLQLGLKCEHIVEFLLFSYLCLYVYTVPFRIRLKQTVLVIYRHPDGCHWGSFTMSKIRRR